MLLQAREFAIIVLLQLQVGNFAIIVLLLLQFEDFATIDLLPLQVEDFATIVLLLLQVGDFATVVTAPSGDSKTVAKASVIIGTPVYLAPEAYSFEISTKLDSYSFGVVLLEVITGWLVGLCFSAKSLRFIRCWVRRYRVFLLLVSVTHFWSILQDKESWRPNFKRTQRPDDAKTVGHQTCRKQNPWL